REAEHLGVDRFLGREVVQQARPPQADGPGDLVQRGAVVAVIGEAATCLDDDRVPRREDRFGGSHRPRVGDPPRTTAALSGTDGRYGRSMDIVAAVYIENIELRPAPGPSTRI